MIQFISLQIDRTKMFAKHISSLNSLNISFSQMQVNKRKCALNVHHLTVHISYDVSILWPSPLPYVESKAIVLVTKMYKISTPTFSKIYTMLPMTSLTKCM